MTGRNYTFLRQLTAQASDEETAKIIAVLENNQIEIYKSCGETFAAAFPNEEVPGGSLYVSAADREAAETLLKEAGLGAHICEPRIPAGARTLVEQAQEEYYRKRKIGMIECLVVIVLALLYYLWKI